MAKKILFAVITAGVLAVIPSLAHAEDGGLDGGAADLSTLATPDASAGTGGNTTTQSVDDGCSSLPGRANTSSLGLLFAGSLVLASLLVRRRA
jgi:hypothetical protein